MNLLNKMIKDATTKLNQENWDSKLAKLDVKDCSLYKFAKFLKNKQAFVPPFFFFI
jgi:hypothetical protein